MDVSKINLQKNTHQRQIAGFLKKDIINLLGLSLPSDTIFIYPGAIKHIKKRHKNDFQKYFDRIPEIIDNPDYIGVNTRHKDSVELVKVFDDDVLVAIKLDPSGYLFLSSMYSLTASKVPKRLKSGRLIKYKP